MTDKNNDLAPSKPPIWNDPKYRALFFQIILIVGLARLFYHNRTEYTQQHGIPRNINRFFFSVWKGRF